MYIFLSSDLILSCSLEFYTLWLAQIIHAWIEPMLFCFHAKINDIKIIIKMCKPCYSALRSHVCAFDNRNGGNCVGLSERTHLTQQLVLCMHACWGNTVGWETEANAWNICCKEPHHGTTSSSTQQPAYPQGEESFYLNLYRVQSLERNSLRNLQQNISLAPQQSNKLIYANSTFRLATHFWNIVSWSSDTQHI